jgi:hypothetical protein
MRGKRWMEADIRCIEGDLMLAQGDATAAEACCAVALASLAPKAPRTGICAPPRASLTFSQSWPPSRLALQRRGKARSVMPFPERASTRATCGGEHAPVTDAKRAS